MLTIERMSGDSPLLKLETLWDNDIACFSVAKGQNTILLFLSKNLASSTGIRNTNSTYRGFVVTPPELGSAVCWCDEGCPSSTRQTWLWIRLGLLWALLPTLIWPWRGSGGAAVCCGFKALPGSSSFSRLEHRAVILCSTGLAALAALCLITFGCCWDACPASCSCLQPCRVPPAPWQQLQAPLHPELPSPARSSARWSGKLASTPTRSLPTGKGPILCSRDSLLCLAQQWELVFSLPCRQSVCQAGEGSLVWVTVW